MGGCGCGGQVRQWQPARQAAQPEEPPAEDGAELTPNEKIQARLHQQAAARTWPATWNGHEHTPAAR